MIIQSGEKVPFTGYYKYIGHKNNDYDNCIIVDSMKRMLFKEGHTALSTGSCKHEIYWAFVNGF